MATRTALWNSKPIWQAMTKVQKFLKNGTGRPNGEQKMWFTKLANRSKKPLFRLQCILFLVVLQEAAN
jgi:hypothetical protein